MTARRKLFLLLCAGLTPVVLAVALLVAIDRIGSVSASSHREAPAISKDPYADNTDTYVWIPQGSTDRIVLAASWIPGEFPEGGPNYYEWDDNVAYIINVDNDGDATADITYTLQSRTTIRNPTGTFLYNTGPLDQPDDPDWNRPQYITVTENLEDGTANVLVAGRPAPPVNIGSKSTPNYQALADQHIYTSPDGQVKVYAGQTDDPFWVDLQVFDLLTLRGQAPSVGYSTGNNDPVDSLSGFNVHSLVIELPITRVTNGSETVVGVWASSRRRPMSPPMVASPSAVTAHFTWPQVSRLGMPLVNEVVIPMGVKDTFNTLLPEQDLAVYTTPPTDAILQEAVQNPEVGTLLCALYGVPLPGDTDNDCNTEHSGALTGRTDIVDIFLRGMVTAETFTVTTAGGPVALPPGTNVNRPGGEAGGQPSEMLRINTALSGDTCHPNNPRLGLLAGDACGFPNGRDLMDDIVEIELLAVAGAAYDVLAGDDADPSFDFNPALIGVLDDNVDVNDVPFRTTFPYMAVAQSGQEHCHENPDDDPNASSCEGPTPVVVSSFTAASRRTQWLQVSAALAAAGSVALVEYLRRRRVR